MDWVALVDSALVSALIGAAAAWTVGHQHVAQAREAAKEAKTSANKANEINEQFLQFKLEEERIEREATEVLRKAHDLYYVSLITLKDTQPSKPKRSVQVEIYEGVAVTGQIIEHSDLQVPRQGVHSPVLRSFSGRGQSSDEKPVGQKRNSHGRRLFGALLYRRRDVPHTEADIGLPTPPGGPRYPCHSSDVLPLAGPRHFAHRAALPQAAAAQLVQGAPRLPHRPSGISIT